MNLRAYLESIPRVRAVLFDHPDWLFELKDDSYRAVAYDRRPASRNKVILLNSQSDRTPKQDISKIWDHATAA